MTSFPWLTVLWAVPMVGAGLVMLLPSAQRTLAKWVALAISAVVLALTVVLAVGFEPGGAPYQFVESHTCSSSPAGTMPATGPDWRAGPPTPTSR